MSEVSGPSMEWFMEAVNYKPDHTRAPKNQDEVNKIYVSFAGNLEAQKTWEFSQMKLAVAEMWKEVQKSQKELSDWNQYWIKYATHSRDFPQFAFDCIILYGMLTHHAARDLAQNAWRICEFPERNLGRDAWMEIFEQTGYLTDNELYVDPGWYTVYRGTLEPHRTGMAWSDSLSMARFFARRITYGDQIARVYAARVPHTAVLARFGSRGESEWVIDTEYVKEVRDLGSILEVGNDNGCS